MLIPNVTEELVVHHFKTLLHAKQANFFEFLRHKNCSSIASMTENVKQLKKKQEEFKLWKEKSSYDTSGWNNKRKNAKVKHEHRYKGDRDRRDDFKPSSSRQRSIRKSSSK